MPGDTLSDYLLDNYGQCALGTARCALAGKFRALQSVDVDYACMHRGWLGRDCPHWRPLGATSYEQLHEMAYDKGDK